MGKEEDEGGKAAVGTSLRVSFSIAAGAAAPNQPSYSSNPLKEKRRMFSVELNPGHTTIVSWKKLLKGSNTNIESSRENNNASRGGPAAADEYFQVDKLSTKHNAYFVNRGKLEGIEASSSPGLAPKKRKRKDSTEVDNKTKSGQANMADGTMGNKRIKAATKNAPLIGKNLMSPARIQSANGEHHQGKILQNNINTFTGNSRPMNFTTDVENIPSGLSKDVSLQSFESNRRKGVFSSRDPTDKSRRIHESVCPAQHEPQDKAVGSQVESRSRKSLNCDNAAEISTTVRWKEPYGTNGIPRMDSNVDTYPMHLLKGGSSGRPKSTALESAIHDLEKIVALCRPQKLDIQDMGSSSHGVKRSLPQDVKRRLAKVARLSAGQSKISEDDLIDRLMDIVGHMVQRKTLKRNIREMTETGPSAKQQKSDQKQLIKKEVKKMIMIRVSLLKSKVAEQQVGSAEDFQVSANEERRVLKNYIMDSALEDKLSELYDLYGIHEDKGPQRRNLFKELAEFWPNGYMDCNRIKDAISRSKARKRSRFYRHKVCDAKGIKMKKLTSAAMVEETNRHVRSPSTNSTSPARIVLTSNQPVVSSSLLGDSGRHHLSKHRDKARISSSSTSIVRNVKKMMKRKPESDLGVIHDHPAKIVQQTREIPNSQKHGEGSYSCHQTKQILRLPATSLSSDLWS